MNVTFGIIGILLAIFIITYLVIKGVDIYISTMCAMIAVTLCSGINPITAFTDSFMPSAGSYLVSMFPFYISGMLFAGLLESSGAAEALANLLIKVFGKKYSLLAVAIALIVICYAGSGSICLFALFPVMIKIFQENDIPRYLLPALYWLGTATGANCAPGTVQALNVAVTTTLGVSPMAGGIPGFVSAIVMLILGWLFIDHFVKKAKKLGHHFNPEGLVEDKPEQEDRKLPNGIISFLPLIVVVVCTNIKADGVNIFSIVEAMLIGFVVTGVLFFRYIPWKKVTGICARAVKNSIDFIGPVCAVVGFGTVVSSTAAFTVIKDAMLSLQISPLVSLAIATNVICAMTGSATGSASMVASILGPAYVNMGLNPEVIARTICVSAVAFDTVPHNSFVVGVGCGMCRETHKTFYWPMACVAIIAPIAGIIVFILTAGLFY